MLKGILESCIHTLYQTTPAAPGLITSATAAEMLAKGDFESAGWRNLFGLTALNLSSLNAPPEVQESLVKTSVLTQALTVSARGLRTIYDGIVEKGVKKLTKGAVQVLGGAAAGVLAAASSARSLSTVFQTATLISMFGILAAHGIRDIRKGDYLKGALKTAVGLGSAAASAYWLYRELDFNSQEGREIQVASVYNNYGDNLQNDISSLSTANHRKYAEKWNLRHEQVEGNLVEHQCTRPDTRQVVDCSEEWNRIKYLKNVCDQRSQKRGEFWTLCLKSDAVFTNANIDPSIAIDRLRQGRDTSFIVATEGKGTRYNPGAVNAGVMILRNDLRGCNVIQKIWETRDTRTSTTNTYGDGSKGGLQGAIDHCLWGALSRERYDDITVIRSRDKTHPTRGDIAFGTLNRGGCAIARLSDGSLGAPYDIDNYDREINPDGIWQEGDWIGQTAGYPMYGKNLAHRAVCIDDPSIPLGPIRIEKVRQMNEAFEKSLLENPKPLQMLDVSSQVTDPGPILLCPKRIYNPFSITSKKSTITFGTIYDNSYDPRRQAISDFVNQNHAEYAQAWGLQHRVISESLVQNECAYPNSTVTHCAPYWNKIKMILDWSKQPSNPQEENWFIFIDDDMLVTDMTRNPYEALNSLREGEDTSVIIPLDVIDWQKWFFPNKVKDAGVNTGFIAVRNDVAGQTFIQDLWNLRFTPVQDPTPEEPNLGITRSQMKSMQEQEAAAILIRNGMGEMISTPAPRDLNSTTRADIAINTFYRSGCFTKDDSKSVFSFDKMDQSENPSGAFQPGDWMSQPAGVPVYGRDIPMIGKDCVFQDVAPGPTRLNKLKELSKFIVRKAVPDSNLGAMAAAGAALALLNGIQLPPIAPIERIQPLAPPEPIETDPVLRAEQSLQRMSARAERLIQKSLGALDKGGKLIYQQSNSGLYRIQNENRELIAVFKPQDERLLGPNNANPSKRRAEPTDDDIEFHQLSALEQGKPHIRQFLSTYFEPLVPSGAIADIRSDLFISNPNSAVQTKTGFLQEWVPNSKPLINYHPAATEFFQNILPNDPNAIFPEKAYSIVDNPIINRIHLGDYQSACIMNILLYNQDGHAANYLVSPDQNGISRLKSIDTDSILPWKLNNYLGLTSHPRSQNPYTKEALDLIEQIDPEHNKALVEKLGLPKQSAINAKALAIMLKRFSAHDLSLHEVHKFISSPVQDAPSPMWNMMLECQKTAISKLSDQDQKLYKHAEWLRFVLWHHNGRDAPPDARAQLDFYNLNFRNRIEQEIERHFWHEFDIQLDRVVAEG